MLTENPNPEAAPLPMQREFPHSIQLEQGLLGLLLCRNELFETVAEVVDEDHFYDPLHRQIFAEIARTVRAGRLATPPTLARVFEADEPITDTLTVPQYLGTLAANAAPSVSARRYASEILDLAKRRELIAIGEDIVASAYSSSVADTAEDQITAAEAALSKLAETGPATHVEIPFSVAAAKAAEMAQQAYQSGGKMRGVSTGFRDLDGKLGGLQESDLIILAGRPSMGKTALVTNIAWNVARDGLPVDFFSLEMGDEQLATRILAEQIGVPSDKIRRGDVTETEISEMVRAAHRLRDTPLNIDITGGISIAQLAARARRSKRKRGTALIVVDYLQLMQSASRRPSNNRVADVTEITTGLKALAKELQVPILALSQLSRAVESRTEKRPQLADLRESGSIEQDADVVMFVYREEYYVERTQPDPSDYTKWSEWQASMNRCAGKAEVIIGKQRHGPVGTVQMAFDGALTRFSDLARDYQMPERHA